MKTERSLEGLLPVKQYQEEMWRMAKRDVEYHLLDSSKLEEAAKRGDTSEVVFTDYTWKRPGTLGLGTPPLDALYDYRWVHAHLFGRSDPYKLSGRSDPYRKNCNPKCHFEVTRMPDYMQYVYALLSG